MSTSTFPSMSASTSTPTEHDASDLSLIASQPQSSPSGSGANMGPCEPPTRPFGPQTAAAAAPTPPSPALRTAEKATVIDIPQGTGNGIDSGAGAAHLSLACPHPDHIYFARLELPAPSPSPPPPPPPAPSVLVLDCHGEARGGSEPPDEKKYMADYQRCCPPPLFVIMISLLEIGVFVYDYMTVEAQPELSSPTIPSDSVLLYRPDRRQEIWRFFSYMVLHANWFHLSFNVVIQLLYGLPLEMVHGSARIAVIYLAGVFAGSLGTSVVDSEVYLVGASGGVYALLAAQLANILLNFGQMRYGISQLVSVVIFVSCDLGYALYTQYCAVEASSAAPSVSYIAHLTGALAGFTIGLLVLKNFEHKAHENLVWWLALGVYSAFTIFAIVFNLMNTVTAQLLEEKGEAIKQHLLHDLGVS